jgi:hypothetical protein
MVTTNGTANASLRDAVSQKAGGVAVNGAEAVGAGGASGGRITAYGCQKAEIWPSFWTRVLKQPASVGAGSAPHPPNPRKIKWPASLMS